MNEDPASKLPSEPPESPLGKREESAKIPRRSKGASEKSFLDGILGKYAYHILFTYVDIFILTLIASRFWDNEELVQIGYYFFTFIGAALLAILVIWRARQSEREIRQSERQMENARFEKAVDMATDLKNRTRRASGFRILRQMFSDSGEDFDDTTEKNIEILDYLVLNSFKRTGRQEEAFMKLYEQSKISFGADEDIISESLFNKTHKPDIRSEALRLWIGIVNRNMMRWSNPAGVGIYSNKTTPNKSPWFIFSGGSLENLQFFVSDRGEITSSNRRAQAGFTRSCFLLVDMHGVTVDHVDFSRSHFSKINLEGENKENCEMSCVGTIFDKANLIFCNFRGANFKGASFVGITALEVIFDKANLTDCKFEGANLGGASFVGTDISSSDFRLAKNLTQGQFEKAYWIMPAKPQFPKGWTDDFINSLARQAQN